MNQFSDAVAREKLDPDEGDLNTFAEPPNASALLVLQTFLAVPLS